MTTPAEKLAIYSNQSQLSSFFTNKVGIFSILSYADKEDIFNGVTIATSALNSAITDATVEGGILVIPTTENGSTYIIDDDVTIPSNVLLWNVPGAILKGSAGTETLTINGQISRDLYQKFDNILVAGTPKNLKIHPEWFGAIGDGTVDDTTALADTVTALKAFGGGTLFLTQTYSYTAFSIDQEYIHIKGHGTLKNGTLTIGSTTRKEMYMQIENPTFEQADNTTNSINIKFSRRINIGNCKFTNGDKSIYIMPEATHTNHDVGLINVTKCEFTNNNYTFYADKDAGAVWSVLNDCHIVNNIMNYSRICHIYCESIDGIKIAENTMFFPSYDNVSLRDLKTNNIYIGKSDWIEINDNNLFEAGYEHILLEDPQNVTIADNHMAWGGQRELKSHIKIYGTNANDVYGSITGNNLSRITKHGIEITGTQDIIGSLIIKDNPIRYKADTNTYFGVTDITSIDHYSVFLDTLITTLPEMKGNTGNVKSFPVTTSEHINENIETNGISKSLSVTGADTELFSLSDVNNDTDKYDGMIYITTSTVTTSAGNNASYILHISKDTAGNYNVHTISNTGILQGYISGDAANWLGFDFKLDGTNNKLEVTPRESTSGTFYFYAHALGNIKLKQ